MSSKSSVIPKTWPQLRVTVQNFTLVSKTNVDGKSKSDLHFYGDSGSVRFVLSKPVTQQDSVNLKENDIGDRKRMIVQYKIAKIITLAFFIHR